MSLSQHGPSPFAVLLRRSKFASYDPQIGQIYTTYGGHAHRGNWGFKRPLPNRRSNGFIFMRKIDTPEQQTDWNTAESAARWMKRWDDMGKRLKVPEIGQWRTVPISISSEFDSNARRKDPVAELSENDYRSVLATMPRKQYEKYVERLRKLRPAFKEFLLKEELIIKNDPKWRNSQLLDSQKSGVVLSGGGEVNMFASKLNQNHFDPFLNGKAAGNNPYSTAVYPKPQKFAGLEYTHMSQLQANYLRKPFPGRAVSSVQQKGHSGKEEPKQVIAAGGLVGTLPSQAERVPPTDFGTDTGPRVERNHGKGMFRLANVELIRAPSVVNRRPEGVKDAKFTRIEFVSAKKMETNHRENPHPLGSADYVAMHSTIQSPHYIPGVLTNLVALTKSTQPMAVKERIEMMNRLKGMTNKPREEQ